MNFRNSKALLEEIDISVPFSLYHDESGRYHCDRWVVTGLLWIPENCEDYIYKVLQDIREKNGYYSKIHYYNLPSKFEGKHNADARVARDWMNMYIRNIAYITYFYAIAVNTHSQYYERDRFSKYFHEYNRFTAQAIKSSLIWNMNEYKVIKLQIFSDNKVNRPGGLLGDGTNYDNFEEYLEYRISLDEANDSRIPTIIFRDKPVICVNKEEAKRFPKKYEMLQLCDILVSSISGAILGRSKVETKSWLSSKIAELMVDIRKNPREQSFKLNRRFSLSYFPNHRGYFYKNGPVSLSCNSKQYTLF